MSSGNRSIAGNAWNDVTNYSSNFPTDLLELMSVFAKQFLHICTRPIYQHLLIQNYEVFRFAKDYCSLVLLVSHVANGNTDEWKRNVSSNTEHNNIWFLWYMCLDLCISFSFWFGPFRSGWNLKYRNLVGGRFKDVKSFLSPFPVTPLTRCSSFPFI